MPACAGDAKASSAIAVKANANEVVNTRLIGNSSPPGCPFSFPAAHTIYPFPVIRTRLFLVNMGLTNLHVAKPIFSAFSSLASEGSAQEHFRANANSQNRSLLTQWRTHAIPSAPRGFVSGAAAVTSRCPSTPDGSPSRCPFPVRSGGRVNPRRVSRYAPIPRRAEFRTRRSNGFRPQG
jgi:hypothetical protein